MSRFDTRLVKFLTIGSTILFGSHYCSPIIAQPLKENHKNHENHNVVMKKIEYEENQDSNPYAITVYEPNYILPMNYTFSPSPIYKNMNNNQNIQHTDFKFQFSLKTPILRNFLGQNNALYLAYTQKSFWQAYNKSAFFRANNYQPEIFLENNINIPLNLGWNFQLFNIGLIHQSNGRGGLFERTWNRIYVDAIFSKEHWLISLRPWLIVNEKGIKNYNPDIRRYLGHGRLLVAYKYNQQVISVVCYNNLESSFKRGSVQVSYSFPLINKIRGYIQAFNGFGQSLDEYNHRTGSVGVGISVSDWL